MKERKVEWSDKKELPEAWQKQIVGHRYASANDYRRREGSRSLDKKRKGKDEASGERKGTEDWRTDSERRTEIEIADWKGSDHRPTQPWERRLALKTTLRRQNLQRRTEEKRGRDETWKSGLKRKTNTSQAEK